MGTMAANSTSTAQKQCAPIAVCLIVGVVIFVVFISTDTFTASDPEFFIFFIVAFVLIIACAGGSSAQAAKRRQALAAQGTYTTQPQPQPAPNYQPQAQFQSQPQYYPQAQPQSQPHVIEREKVIIKEIVKIKCSYCGALVESTQSFCHNCGANM